MNQRIIVELGTYRFEWATMPLEALAVMEALAETLGEPLIEPRDGDVGPGRKEIIVVPTEEPATQPVTVPEPAPEKVPTPA